MESDYNQSYFKNSMARGRAREEALSPLAKTGKQIFTNFSPPVKLCLQ